MFDGNHRTRRNVNLGSTNNNRRQQQAATSTIQNNNNRKQSSRLVVGSNGIEITSTTSITTNTNSNTISNACILLEETKRRRIERRIVQQRNISSIIISKYYRGYSTRRTILQQIESTIQQLLLLPPAVVSSNTVDATDATDTTKKPTTNNIHLNSNITNVTFTNIRKVTVLFNLRYRLLLPITEQQQQNNSNRHNKKSTNTTTSTSTAAGKTTSNTALYPFLQQYVTYIIQTIYQFTSIIIQDKEHVNNNTNLILLLMLNALPSPYMAHRIVQQIIIVLYNNNNNNNNRNNNSNNSSYVDDDKLITTLSFLLGISINTQQQQKQQRKPNDTTTIAAVINTSNCNDTKTTTTVGSTNYIGTTTNIDDTGKWKRLGNGSNFSTLLDCYFRRLQTLQEQHQNQVIISTDSATRTSLLNNSISSMYSIIQQLVPSTQVGHAFQVAIQLTVPSCSSFLLFQQQQNPQQQNNHTSKEDTKMSSSTTISSFTSLVEPLVLVISSSLSSSSSNINDMDVGKKVEEDYDQELLVEATKRLISQSSVQLLLNAIQLYRQDIVNVSNEDSITRIRMTSLLVQLVQCVFCTPESSNDNDKPIRTLLTILIGRKIRGDDIDFGSTTTTTSKLSDHSNNSVKMSVSGLEGDDDDDVNDDDDDDINENGKRNTTSLEASTTIGGSNNNAMSIDASIAESNSNRRGGGGIQFPGKERNVENWKNRRLVSSNKSNQQQQQSTAVSSRLQRHELLTSSKLDSIYKSYSKEYCQWSDVICGTIINNNSKRKQNGGAVLLSSRVNQIQLLDIQSIGKLTNELSNPDLILQWGDILFSKNTTTMMTKREVEQYLEMGRTAFVTVLGILLQLTTGLRERQSYASTFLSKLAFDTKLLAMIWTYMINKIQTERILLQNDKTYKSLSYLSSSTYLGFAIFSDLFSHTLISAKDDTFVQLYTNATSTTTTQYDKKIGSIDNTTTTIPPGGFLASDVIICIRDLLYELYWTKPVQVTDFDCILPSTVIQDDLFEINGRSYQIQQQQQQQQQFQSKYIHSARARLFLSGTKLWNSLYERWTRLVIVRSRDGSGNSDDNSTTGTSTSNNTSGNRRNDICHEATWWFPPMTGALSAGTSHSSAVVSASSDVTQRRRTNRRNNNNSNRAEDIDEDMNSNNDLDGDEDDMSIDSVNTDSNSIHSQTMGENDDTAAVEAESDAMAETFSDPKLARILTCIPQSVSFDKRVKLFDSLLRTDKRKSQVDNDSHLQHALLAMMRGEDDGDFMSGGRVRINIRRDHLYEDSKEKLNSLGSANALKKRVQVSFTNQLGTAEAGIDGGGVFKEFIDDLIKDAFSAKKTLHQLNDDNNENEETTSNQVTATYQLFTVTPLQALRINSSLFTGNSVVDSELLPHYEFLGRVLGKAVYESILVEPQFCLPFLNQLLGKNNSIEDLKNYDPEYYRNLTKLLSLSRSDIDSLGLYFEITSGSDNTNNGNDGMTRTVELFPGGSRVQVTKDNVIQFIHLIAHRRLNIETAQATKSFLIGFRDLIPVSWVRLFSAYELQRLISGDDSVKGIDVESFKASMQYAAGYHPSQPVIEWFWEIVEEMTVNQQHKLLKFMTSCSRQPLLGFRSLEPAPCIQQIRLPDNIFESNTVAKQAPLPTASTCMNLLKLPNYRSKDIMKQKIVAAIESGSGFELT